ncbi:sulfate/molybdate ABC transporter ATP-binding protein [Konateibacter massiliensis]|uniref:sulfate/molybdate ABC transporter ATP-binding protein n=1 Tax=Konateibacter massiliensis TaxID=2002841 RepID=UPI000C14C13D|nr:ATP-binding cassette domain-containing protein [Konateibacter massiliensis]
MGLQVDIKKRMQNFSLDVTFDIECETLSILGASGSGKSMTLKCIAGIETPDEGTIVLDEQILFDSRKKINLLPQQRGIGYLFQNYALFPNMTVEENIGAGLRVSPKEKNKLIEEKITAFYLEGLEKKKPNQLSGGQQQRVALARMIAADPKIIMLDEPFSALDSYLRWELEQEILDIIEVYQKPTLFVSHNRDEVYRISDLIGIMDQGKLELVGDKKSLFQNPQLLTGAILTGCKNFTRIKKTDEHKVYALDWQLELETKLPVTSEIKYIGIRAHDIRVVNWEDETANTVICKVLKIIDNTFTTIIILENVMRESKTKEDNFDKYSEIRLEIEKGDWEKVKDSQVKLKFSPDALLLLK